ncbi:MAG: transporter substrate-binding domain-containing protein, partial [Candidatus Competibacterales bacterium]
MSLGSRLFGFFAPCLLAVVAVPGQAQEVAPPGELAQSGRLTYGTAATFAPFEYVEDGELTGFDIEMGALLAEKMGLEPQPMNMEFNGLIPALQGGRM